MNEHGREMISTWTSHQTVSESILYQFVDWIRLMKERWIETMMVFVAFQTARLNVFAHQTCYVSEITAMIPWPNIRTIQWKRETSGHIEIIEFALALQKIIEYYQLDDIWKVKPLLDGSRLIDAVNLPRGPLVGKVMEEQMKYMMYHRARTAPHPEELNIETLIEHLRNFVVTNPASITTR
jgi:hypothetical protein